MSSVRFDRVVLGLFSVSSVFALVSACSASNATPITKKNNNGSAGSGAGAEGGTSGVGTAGSGVGTAGTGVGAGGTGTAGTGAGTAGTGTGTAGTGAGTAGTGAGTAGTGSTSTPMPLCTSKITVASTQIVNFENYDGMVAIANYGWDFGGATDGTAGVHAGPYSFNDGTATPTFSILAGHTGNYGLTESVTNASAWGEGFGFFLLDSKYAPGCINASAYKGITMWVRGTVPTNTFSFSLSMAQATLPDTTTTPASGGSCTGTDDKTCKAPTKGDLPISTTWSQVNIMWADLTGGLSGPAVPLAANGDNITGFSFSAGLKFVPEADGSTTYVAVPGDVSISVDDIAFIP